MCVKTHLDIQRVLSELCKFDVRDQDRVHDMEGLVDKDQVEAVVAAFKQVAAIVVWVDTNVGWNEELEEVCEIEPYFQS